MELAPKLTVRLATDASGEPAVRVDEKSGKRHYKVVFEVDDAPTDTYAATFELDPTYYDPVRTLTPDADGKFRLETTTYGNYAVLVRLHRAKGNDVTLKENIARALTKTMNINMTARPAWTAALNYIAQH